MNGLKGGTSFRLVRSSGEERGQNSRGRQGGVLCERLSIAKLVAFGHLPKLQDGVLL